MSSKAHKRREYVEASEDAVEERSDKRSIKLPDVIPAVRSMLSLVSAHRWKALGVAAAVAVGTLLSMGVIDPGAFTSRISQYASSWSEPSAQTASGTDTPSALDAVAELPKTAKHLVPKSGAARTTAAAIVAAPSISPCFTPDENCTARVTAAIDSAASEILVQAYSLTTANIIDALGRAHARGVKVRVILDKADERDQRSGGARLISKRILPYVDHAVEIAHSKVIVIDQGTVITSSFNFNKAAQKANAEDMLMIQGHPEVAAAYRRNWEKRLATSRPYYGTMAPVL